MQLIEMQVRCIRQSACWEEGMINLMHGDCLERMKEIPDASVDMILCDLPYGTTACGWDPIISFFQSW